MVLLGQGGQNGRSRLSVDHLNCPDMEAGRLRVPLGSASDLPGHLLCAGCAFVAAFDFAGCSSCLCPLMAGQLITYLDLQPSQPLLVTRVVRELASDAEI